MSKIEDRLVDYKSLRDSSKKILMADLEHARETFSAKGLSSRYLGGVVEGAKDVYEVAKVHTLDNRGIIAIVLGALALWFGREPLLAAMAEEFENDALDDETDASPPVQPSDTEASLEEPATEDINDS